MTKAFKICIALFIMMATGCNMGNNHLTETSASEERTAIISFTQNNSSEASSTASTQTIPYDGNYPQHSPLGTGIGAMPGRVVWAYDPDSVEWDGSGYWWKTDHFDEAVILKMVNGSIASLGGKETAKDGWNALFASNKNVRGMSGGYAKGEKIAIKANINGSAVFDDDTSGETHMSYTMPTSGGRLESYNYKTITEVRTPYYFS